MHCYVLVLTLPKMDSHKTCLQNKLRNLKFLQWFLYYSTKVDAGHLIWGSTHFAKINGDLTGLLHTFFSKCWLKRPIFHLYKSTYTDFCSHIQFQSKTTNCPQIVRPTTSSTFKWSDHSKFHLRNFSTQEHRMQDALKFRSHGNAKSKRHVPAGTVRSQTPILPVSSSTYRNWRKQKL